MMRKKNKCSCFYRFKCISFVIFISQEKNIELFNFYFFSAKIIDNIKIKDKFGTIIY